MFYGGVYIDADSECLRPIDQLLHDELSISQGAGFLEKDLQYINGLVASGVIATYPFSPLSITLVALLNDADWTQPPWMSAGPMHFTKTLKRFENASVQYWDIKILDSFLVYPYHHSDRNRPVDPTSVLVEKGSVMDQQWGTTHNSYGVSDAWKEDLLLDASAMDWLESYVHNVHGVGLSSLALRRPRWVVAELDPGAGMCNRIAHILSSLAFAMATGRVLLFDWTDVPLQMHADGIEIFMQAHYDAQFAPAPFNYSYSAAVSLFGNYHESQRIMGDALIEDLRYADLDAVYRAPIITIARNDWWAAPLMQNDLYREYVFENRSSAEVFAELFKFLFRPKETVSTIPCDWMIQYRTQWERPTAPIESFYQCMGENETAELVTDYNRSGCRDSLSCHLQTINTMYTMATSCKRAVLTQMSTFGACIAGLGLMTETYSVAPDGTCHRRPFIDPIDAGTLPGTRTVVTDVVRDNRAGDDNGKQVYVYILPSNATDTHIRSMQRTIVAHSTLPVVCFVPGNPERWRFLRFISTGRVIVVGGSFSLDHHAVRRYDGILMLS